MFGWIDGADEPAHQDLDAEHASSSGCVQPFSSVVCEYTSASTTSPVTSASSDWSSWSEEVDAVLQLVQHAERERRAS